MDRHVLAGVHGHGRRADLVFEVPPSAISKPSLTKHPVEGVEVAVSHRSISVEMTGVRLNALLRTSHSRVEMFNPLVEKVVEHV